MSLREAASVVFGLAAVLPILLFVYLLSSANLLHRTDVQIGLFSAVTVSALGFLVFRRMIGQIARLAELQPPRLSQPAAAGGEARAGCSAPTDLACRRARGWVRLIGWETRADYMRTQRFS